MNLSLIHISHVLLGVGWMEGNVPGAPGRETCQLVQLLPGGDGYLARPVFGKSGLITTLTEADGFTMIPVNREGLHTGEKMCIRDRPGVGQPGIPVQRGSAGLYLQYECAGEG